jgi:diguanylate cyclase (GGDEF)-like protein
MPLKLKNANVLIVDDSPASIDFMIELLKKYDVTAVTSAKEAREAMEEEPPDLILLDINMPEIDGFTFCTEIKKDPRKRDIPIIFLTASTDPEDIRHALSIGGADYITKPYLAEIVSLRIRTQLELVRLRKELRLVEMFDSLSGTKKKEVFDREAKHWFQYAITEEKPVTMFALSINNLREINLKFDIDTADAVIRSAAQVLKSSTRKNMLLTRMGGGLFVGFVYGVSGNQFEKSLQQIKEAIEKTASSVHPELKIELCGGLSDSSEVHTYEELLKTVLDKNNSCDIK